MHSSKAKDSLTICNKLKKKDTLSQSKMKPVKLPPICHTREEEELWDIKALPSDWEPDTRPSKTIRNLMRKREKEHNETVEAMKKEMTDINSLIEDNIRVASVIYKECLKTSKKEIDESLNNIRQVLKGPADLALTHFAKAIDDIIAIYRLNKYRLFTLLQKLKTMEKCRSEDFKRILKVAYNKMNEISFKLPFEIQEYFEQEIEAINETTLSNIKAYNQLKAELGLHLRNEMRLCLCEVQYLKEIWLYCVKYTLFTQLNQDRLFDADYNQETLKTTVMEESSSTCSDWKNDSTINVDKMYTSIAKIEDVMHQIDKVARVSVGNFKKAVIKVVMGYFEDMKKMIQTILDVGIIENWEIKDLKSEFCGQAVINITGKYTEELQQMQNIWDNVKRELQKCLQYAFVVLNSFSEIWYTHFQRIQNIKSLVLQDLKRTMVNGYLQVCAEETKINIKIDTLRQVSDTEQFDQLMDVIAQCLNNLEGIYQQNYQAECGVVESITELFRMEGELLESELEYFIDHFYDMNKYPVNVESFTLIPSSKSEVSAEDNKDVRNTLLATEIAMCKAQIMLLDRFKEGLHIIVNKFMSICKEENAELAQEWMKSQQTKSKWKLQMILELLHPPRYKRVKPLISDLRQAEIEEYHKRFKEHQAGINQEIDNVSVIFPRYEQNYVEIRDECQASVEQIKDRVINAKNSATVMSETMHFQSMISACMDKVVQVNSTYETNFNLRIKQIFGCNLLYLKAIKLFSEGGNFSASKTKEICRDLSKTQKRYKKKLATLSRTNEKKCAECLQFLGDTKFKLTEFLSKLEDELKHCDNYNYALKDIKVELAREVYSLKFKCKQLVSTLNKLSSTGEKIMGATNSLDNFIQLAKKCTGVIEEVKELLQRPAIEGPFLHKSMSHISLYRGNSTTTTTASLPAAIEKLQAKIKSSANYSDYSSYLFDHLPVKEDGFAGKTHYLLYTSYTNIQENAKKFYSDHDTATFINEDKIHPSYQEFISEILPKYIYYYLQCELIWLEESYNIINVLQEMVPRLKKIRTNFLQVYIDQHFKELQEAFHVIVDDVESIKFNAKQQFFTLYGKLMPLHGYPGNKELLENLNVQVQQFLSEKCEEYIEPFIGYRESLEEKEIDYTKGLFKINDNLKALEEIYEEKTNGKDMISDFADTLLQLRRFVGLPYKFNANDRILANAYKKLEYYKDNIIIPSEYLLYVSDGPVSRSTLTEDESGGLSVNAETLDVIEKIKEYGNEKDNILDKVETVIYENKDLVNSWRDMWDTAVEKVIGLYKVKYDPPANI